MVPTREEALAIVHEYTESPSLRRHMLSVEAAMRAYARKYGEDEDRWGVTGLLHDFDYERWPNDDRAADQEHPTTGVAILREQGVDDDILQAILAHADYTGVEPASRMDHALRAVDDLTGFLVAVALVRPTRLEGMKAKSVRKKMKDRAFAAAIDRTEMVENCEALGEEMGEHIVFVIGAMHEIADDLGLEAQ
ncbi:MAG: HDIG domain-containing protein [Gemmatimonadota bacterium]|nr:HDIG domain-containing protein [Gemmatimonadota bacterium]